MLLWEVCMKDKGAQVPLAYRLLVPGVDKREREWWVKVNQPAASGTSLTECIQPGIAEMSLEKLFLPPYEYNPRRTC